MIAVPPFLIGAGLLFWGWQSGNWITAAVLAVMLEAGRRVRIRFDLGAAEHSRIADLCTILFVGLTVVLAVNRGVAHGILAAFQWLPAALAPILLAQMLSESGRVPLSALFRHMRKLKRDNPSIKDPLIDTSAVYLALVLISAGVANARGPGYYIGVVLAAAWGLFMWRPLHASAAAWVLMLGAGAAGGYAGHAGLAHLQAQLEAWIADWQLGGFDGDPSRSTTDIGSIGKLKLRDALVLRVYVPPAEVKRVRLLHRSSYNTYVGTTWLTRGAPMETVTPEEGGLSWPLAAAQPEWSARMAARVERGRILLSLPSATTRITGLGATAVRRNALGSVQAELAGDWIRYEAEAAASSDTSAPPRREDLAVSAAERATFDGLAAELGLNGLAAQEALRRVQAHFAGYSYSTWREGPAPEGATPLGDFVRNTRSGHCEYFAAATTLLLRAAGIPARYATGFAVTEYSPLEEAFIVRARHAHAWARAWTGTRWIDLDTTPPSWFEEEKQLAPFWEKLADFARWAGYRWSQRGELQASDAWYAVLALLIAILAWRLLRGRRVTRGPSTSVVVSRAWPGADSEFYALERALAQRGFPRNAGMPLSVWVRQTAGALDPAARGRIDEALRLHQRYRFDPGGLGDPERRRLRELCGALLPGS